LTDLKVGGLARLSTCDWPGELVATIFCQGCPWDCPYCHNPHLRPTRDSPALAWTDVLTFLERRRGLLDGVVFSGGEPTLQAALPDAIHAVRTMGFRIGLHTAGPFPERLAALLPSVDWVGLDIKARFGDYERTTGVPGSGDKALASLRHLLDSGVDYEVRTTVHPGLLSRIDLLDLMEQLSVLSVKRYAIQAFRATSDIVDRLSSVPTYVPFDLPQNCEDRFAEYCVR
jgi:pyruvate formate lyase activating enzyme